MKIAVYNLEECIEKGMRFFLELWYNLLLEENHMNQNNIVDSKDKFDNLVCVISSWIVKFNHFSSEINLVLLPMFYKFIVWAVNVWAQSKFGINTISVPTVSIKQKIKNKHTHNKWIRLNIFHEIPCKCYFYIKFINLSIT